MEIRWAKDLMKIFITKEGGGGIFTGSGKVVRHLVSTIHFKPFTKRKYFRCRERERLDILVISVEMGWRVLSAGQ